MNLKKNKEVQNNNTSNPYSFYSQQNLVGNNNNNMIFQQPPPPMVPIMVAIPPQHPSFYYAYQPRIMVPPTMIPPALPTLYDHCAKFYPDQLNPLQVTSVLKYWLGGPDPLDYISMYYNKGEPENDVPPHWHYVSYGLSDLHGDGRVHPINRNDGQNLSGFGFELTFRLKKEPEETSPPTWPASVMQALAKYVFQTRNILYPGDHVSWHCPLDNSESRIQHMLMAEDSQLQSVQTVFGSVKFIQIVGVCYEELKAAQQWNGSGLIDLMKSVSNLGKSYLITDMRRGETLFEIDPELREAVDDGIELQGSNLSGVSAKCSFTAKNEEEKDDDDFDDGNKNGKNNHNKSVLNDNHEKESTTDDNRKNSDVTSADSNNRAASRHSSMSVSHDRNSRMSFASETGTNEPFELIQIKHFDSLHIKLNYEAGILLPLALRGRLKHGRHFTFKNIQGDLAITFVTARVEGSFVNLEQPYALHGPWLQVLIPEEHIPLMLNELDNIESLDMDCLPITYRWDEMNLSISLILQEEQD